MPNPTTIDQTPAEYSVNLLDGSIIEKNAQIFPTTEFADQIAAQEHDLTSANKDLGELLAVRPAESMQTFLERPVTIASVKWTEKSIGVLGTWIFPQAIMCIKSVQCKTGFFKYLRCGVRFIFNFNASTGHYGKLMARWLPLVTQHSVGSIRPATSYQSDPWLSITALDPCPGIDIDATSSSINTMVVPYELATQFIDLEKMFTGTSDPHDYTLGGLRLAVMTPLSLISAEAANIDIQISAALHNVTLDMPMYKEMNFLSKKTEWQARGSRFPMVNSIIHVTKPTTPLYLGYEQHGAPGDDEADQKSSKGIVSTALDTVNTATGFLKNIPVIGDLFDAIDPFTSTIGSLASVFGLGKPVDQMVEQVVTQRMPGLAETNGLLPAKTLTAHTDAALPIVTKGMSTEINEMSLRHIVSRYSYLNTYKVDGDVTTGTRIFEIPISPMFTLPKVEKLTLDGATYEPVVSTFQSWVGSCFAFIRSGIRIRVEVVMSTFQTTKLALSYFPPGTDIPSTISAEDRQNVLSQIFSANGTTVETMAVPYNGDIYARPTYDTADRALVDGLYGTFVLDVYNAIRNTNSASETQPIYINVWYSLAPDAEFFCLSRNDTADGNNPAQWLLPLCTYQSQSGAKVPAKNAKPPSTNGTTVPPNVTRYRQGASADIREKQKVPKPVFGNQPTDLVAYKTNLLGTNLTGEEILSVKDLIQRFTVIPHASSATLDEVFSICPSTRLLTNSKYPFGLFESQGSAYIPYFYWFSLLYRFRRGGINIYAPRLYKSSDHSWAAAVLQPTFDTEYPAALYQREKATAPVNLALNFSHNGVQFWGDDSQQQVIVKAPYMSLSPYTYNNIEIDYSGSKSYYQSDHVQTVVSIGHETNAPAVIALAAADDFSFGKLFAPPTFYRVVTTAGTSA